MVFGGLSEKELEKIIQLLGQNNIGYQIQEDQIINQSNTESMKNNLRHLNPPSISTHILAIEISDEDFNKMDEKLTQTLLSFGITNIIPEDFNEPGQINPSDIHKDILNGNKKIVGFSFIHQIAIILVIALTSYFMTR